MTTISIERMTTGTTIYVKALKSIVDVQDIQFDGYGYDLTVGSRNWSDSVFVEAGGCVDFAGVGEPTLRTDAYITSDEWTAKADAIDADILQLQGRINDAHGHVCQPIDEARRTQFFDAVAKALGVPALEAAE